MIKKIALLLCALLCINTLNINAQDIPASGTALYDTAVSQGGLAFLGGDAAARLSWQTKINKGTSTGFCNCVFDDGYIYTAAVNRIYKINSLTGETVKTANMRSSIGYTYFMAAGDGKLFVQLKNGVVQAFSADTLRSLWVSEVPVCGDSGQGLAPLLYSNGHIYAATVVMSKNFGTGSYYCIDTSDDDPSMYETKHFEWQMTPQDNGAASSGFYWAGAADTGDRLIFGSEGGTVYLVNKNNGSIADSFDTGANIRSSAVYDGIRVYITAKNGSLYSAQVTADGFSDIKSVQFCADSSCTPVIYQNRIYIGGSNGSYTNGVFCVIDKDSLEVTDRFDVYGNVQGRPYIDTAADEVYFNCNYTPGTMMRMPLNGKPEVFFAPDDDSANFCINAVTADDERLYYQNDSGYIVAFERKVQGRSEDTTAEPTTEAAAFTTEETTVTATTAAQSHSGGGGSGQKSEKINVVFTLIGDTPHGSAPHTDFETWIDRQSFVLDKNSTAEDLVKTALDKNGYTYIIQSNGYISQITAPSGTTLSEFTNGVNSGWMYSVNGVFPQSALGAFILKSGDELIFMYSDDYTKTDTSYSGSAWEPPTETTTAETTDAFTVDETSQPPVTVQYFNDTVPGLWYFYPVECLHSAGILNGKGGNNFCPNDNVTRAEFVTMLYRIFGDGSAYAADFADTPKTAWYYDAVAWGQQNGIVYGKDKLHFAPDAPITRQETAAILFRLSNADKTGLTGNTGFKDSDTTAPYAQKAVELLAKNGVIKGADGYFMPQKNATRAEVAVILFNFIEQEIL